jgi:hypothetical protein
VSIPGVPFEYENEACPEAFEVPLPLVADGVPALATENATGMCSSASPLSPVTVAVIVVESPHASAGGTATPATACGGEKSTRP